MEARLAGRREPGPAGPTTGAAWMASPPLGAAEPAEPDPTPGTVVKRGTSRSRKAHQARQAARAAKAAPEDPDEPDGRPGPNLAATGDPDGASPAT